MRLLTRPAAQIIVLFCAIAYAISVEGKKSSLFLLKFCFPMVLLTAFINPATNTRERNINDIGEMQSRQSNFYF